MNRMRNYLSGVCAFALVLGGTMLTGVPAGAASAGPVFPPAVQVTSAESSFQGVSCTSPGNCVAVGSFDVSAGVSQGMVVAQTNGVWGSRLGIISPDAGATSASFDSVSCSAVGECFAVGEYQLSGSYHLMWAIESGGVWPVQASTSGTPNPTPSESGLASASCTSVGNCTAVGWYEHAASDYQGLVVLEVGGIVSTAVPINGPTTSTDVRLESVSCASGDSCTAVGQYRDDGSSEFRAFAISGVGATWGSPEVVGTPYSLSADSAFYGVSCVSVNNCTAGGYYRDASGNNQAMAATLTAGLWAQGIPVVAPYPTTTDSEIYGMSCTTGMICTLAGGYLDDGANFQPWVATNASGVWVASKIVAPDPATANSSFNGLSCSTSEKCTAVGDGQDVAVTRSAMASTSVAPLVLTTKVLTEGSLAKSYSATLNATGGAGSYTYSVSTGSLPAGLTLDAATGVISGTPTAVGVSSFTITVSDPGLPAQQDSGVLTISIVKVATLAATGSSEGTLMVGGLGLVALGGGVGVATRRRRLHA